MRRGVSDVLASGRAPADLFKEPLEQIERAAPEMSKFAVNSMIGLWAIDREYSYNVVSSTFEGDCPTTCNFKRIFSYEGGHITDFVTKRVVSKTTSMRPIHDLTLSHEAMQVGKMLYVCKKQQAAIYELKTDSVLFRPRKRAKTVLPEITAATHVRDLFEPVQDGQVRLDQRFTPPAYNGTDPIYLSLIHI